jgi:putative ABC transport system ATP-binding protein
LLCDGTCRRMVAFICWRLLSAPIDNEGSCRENCNNEFRPHPFHILPIPMISMPDSSAPRDMIQVAGLTKTIQNGNNRVEILRNVSFTVPAGQFVAIMGASGSGKSTLLGLMAGLDNATSGSLRLDGTDITNLKEDQLALVRGRKIGFVFQSYQLVPTLTAEENVLLPAELIGLPGNIEQRARELLDRVGLSNRGHHYPVQLSGGEQQRVALARAFITQPPILMADEPTGNLDSVNGAHILELLLQLNREQKTTLVLVTHDPQVAGHADRLITLRDGSVYSDETTRQPIEAR